MTNRRALATDRVPLHAARVRGGLQLPVWIAPGGADAAERPLRRHLDVVAAITQARDHRRVEARLDLRVPRPRLSRVERAGEVVRVEGGRVDRRLQVEPELDVCEEDVQRPLVLLVAARRAEGEVRLALPQGEG